MSASINSEIAKILRGIGNKECNSKAEFFENQSLLPRNLHLRNLGLTSTQVISILDCMNYDTTETSSIKSVSLSYNTLIGGAGVKEIMGKMPLTLFEFGAVGCEIDDVGGIAILKWMKMSPKLTMVCIEQNNFSRKMRQDFRKYSNDKPHLTFIF